MSIDDNIRFINIVRMAQLPVVEDKGPRENMKAAREMIEQGKLDYAWRNDNGEGVMGALIAARAASYYSCRELLECMLQQGLNLLHASDEEMRVILGREAGWEVMANVLGRAEEQGVGIRNERGENLFHVMARFNVRGTQKAIHQLWEIQKNGVRSVHEQNMAWQGNILWAAQASHDGNTLIHQLWKQISDKDLVDGDIHFTLLITHHLVDLGADILATNQEGETAWDMIKKYGVEPFGLQGILLDKLSALAETKRLDQGTPGALGATKSVRRL